MPTTRLSSARSVGLPRRSIIGGAICPRGVPSSSIALTGRKSARIRRRRCCADGTDACYLEHGITGWSELGLPRRRKLGAGSDGWVTRERPKIDRIACPWLIRRFIDPEARFLFAPTERVFAVAAETGANAYDIPGAEPFSHDGESCSFDAFLKEYRIEDPALDALALIVEAPIRRGSS
jgi:chromate resistance exported protein